MTPTINYITGLYNQVKTLYNNESINTVASEIFVCLPLVHIPEPIPAPC